MSDAEDNPFAGSDADDDYNPFEDKMFDGSAKKKQAAPKSPPVKGPATLNVTESKNEAPDWAKAVDESENSKSDVAKEVESAPTPTKAPPKASDRVPLLSAKSGPDMPDWAESDTKKQPSKQKNPASQQMAIVSGQNYGGTHNEAAPLLSSTVDLRDGETIDPHRTANWPPFSPRCCWPFRPCFHHNFKAELPSWGYSTVKLMFVIWYANALALFWNFIATLAALDCAKCDQNQLFQTVGLALLFLICCIPCSYYCWFNALHNAVRLDSSLKFGLFFFTFVVQILVSIVFAVGFPGTGGAGLWGAIQQLGQGSSEIAFIMFASAILWILLAIIQIVAVQRVLLVFRSSGQSLERAQGEAAKTGGSMAYKAAQTDAGKTVMKGAASAAWNNA
eukprot:m.143424 g.143424  ORF g.143424 m.143424 type:complete len:391 (-) comp30318_c1_seq1:42-1214(-)